MPARPLAVPDAVRFFARSQEGLVSARQCRRAGLTGQQVHRLVASGRWSRVLRGVYDTGEPGDLDLDAYDRRRRRSAVLGPLAYPGSVATGVAALVLHDVQGSPQAVTPEVTFPDGTPRRGAGPVVVRRMPLRRHASPMGVPCAVVEDALVQAVPTVGRLHAVALMDSARQRRAIGRATFGRAADRAGRRPGGLARAGWWSSSDARAESPAETWARLTCADAGCGPDLLQLPVDDATGREVARVDLAWLLPDGGALLTEVDGEAVHGTLAALHRDRERQNRIVGRRTIVQRFTGGEAWDGTMAGRVREVLTAERWHPQAPAPGFRLRLQP
ncbi:type IV toxin-antitoxin system AbiEi family antitoxin domain-containing protein [Isoptericola croceus]|uniref:type IV toxin-antitoxin system AbiEi family antitoxin domain-containing protein n=1 Tax=Isoptericola croceus TaxID=3031406 RepID=UPI0023FA224C|nr:type IV toxin-antitoxin system AbiEi family antitoxin domain-containing protein [Isoptericola croceus]